MVLASPPAPPMSAQTEVVSVLVPPEIGRRCHVAEFTGEFKSIVFPVMVTLSELLPLTAEAEIPAPEIGASDLVICNCRRQRARTVVM